jgi:hypothetical protein
MDPRSKTPKRKAGVQNKPQCLHNIAVRHTETSEDVCISEKNVYREILGCQPRINPASRAF